MFTAENRDNSPFFEVKCETASPEMEIEPQQSVRTVVFDRQVNDLGQLNGMYILYL